MAYRKDLERVALMMDRVKNPVNGGPGDEKTAPNTFAKDSTRAIKYENLGMLKESIAVKDKILKDYDKQFNNYISGKGLKPAYKPNPYGN
jgi:hypothetical protein